MLYRRLITYYLVFKNGSKQVAQFFRSFSLSELALFAKTVDIPWWMLARFSLFPLNSISSPKQEPIQNFWNSRHFLETLAPPKLSKQRADVDVQYFLLVDNSLWWTYQMHPCLLDYATSLKVKSLATTRFLSLPSCLQNSFGFEEITDILILVL